MSSLQSGLWLCILCCMVVVAIPKPDEKPDPPHAPLERDSAHHGHYGEGHNAQYDHEQFLGEDEAKTFEQLEPEESRRRLGIIVDKIDTDKNGLINLYELKSWITFSQNRYIDDDVNRHWKQYNPENNETIAWDVYRKIVYGFMDEMDPSELDTIEGGFSYKNQLARDRRRWSVADLNADDGLTREEFTAFMHPEDRPEMRDVVLTETIEDIDKNNDGKISVEEYIGDMYKAGDSDSEEDEPEWIQNEREVFHQYRDKNNDGFLDREEVREWITPKDYDHALTEAKHLMFEADSNGDELLTKEEIMDKYDLFVGSQATDFGAALERHDEF